MTFKERLTLWNGGIFRGAARHLAKTLRVSDVLVSGWVNNKPPSEKMASEIGALFSMTPAQVLKLFSKPQAAESVQDEPLTARVPLLPVLGPVSADRFAAVYDAPPEEMVPNPEPGNRNLFAFKASGDCMAPTIKHGDVIYMVWSAEAADKKIVLAQVAGGELTLKRFRRLNGEPWLVPDNKKHKKIRVTKDVVIKAVFHGKYLRDL